MINSSALIAKQLAPAVSDSPSLQHQNAFLASAAIEALPAELSLEILRYLPLSTGLHTSQVSGTFKSCVDMSWHWQYRLRQYFPDWQKSLTEAEVQDITMNKDYKSCFIRLYQQHFGKLTCQRQAFFRAVLETDRVSLSRLLASNPALINTISHQGETVLHYIARYGRLETLKLLLSYGATIEAENDVGQSPLHTAVIHHQVDAVHGLLAAGAAIDKLDNEDKTALHYAIASGSFSLSVSLLDRGANPSLACAGWNALHTAAWYGQLELVKYLLQQNADKHAHASHDGSTPLHLAVWNNQSAVAHYLIQQGAAVNISNADGFTPLHLAARYKHLALMQLLVQAGAKETSKDNLGRTPKQLAALYEPNAMLRVLNINLGIPCM